MNDRKMSREAHEDVYMTSVKWVGRTYFDHPDGEDLLGKLSVTTRLAAAAGISAGSMFAVAIPGLNLRSRLARLMVVFVPTVGMATVYTCVTYYSTNIRKKDDIYNHIIGGLAAGSMLGPLFGASYAIGGMLFWTIAGGFGKASYIYNFNIFQNVKRQTFSNYYYRKMDTSFTAYRPGNWTKGAPSD